MPIAPKHPCKAPGCSVLLEAGAGSYCAAHARAPRAAARVVDRARGTAHERGYDARWNTARLQFLAEYPVCMGILIADLTRWTRALAMEFHQLREAERARGMLQYSNPLLTWLAESGIYRLEQWDTLQAATVVDHIIPHRGDPELFWSVWNWQPATKRAHDRKTATEDRPKHHHFPQ